ncbi:cell division cycle-associated protein 3 isoform X1 [Peromyscus maniculatus bairdii]|uniref:cell division cycle-associated protein 3 isoform X1 n=1 Tax=Peromyscus maniculatus bairdii TaxID=230844 RepID=UPI001C2E4A95|nr:cell division cycle-associated protein 3 isoform X1 [Peromyscus maniculatus bairdii]XP_042130044.1 cell division cycle-associated protein 3 isoform X1 [Peromyscus maniculatus bairdii]
MGSTQSISGTPARPLPHNKHLARVADPRSPSAGIQRTPIQVESSPQPSLPTEQLNSPKQAQDPDPRSPTLGIARTPMKIGGTDPQSPLVKELSEAFETEASRSISPPELPLPQQTPLSSELDLPLDTQLSLEDPLLPWSQTELPSKQEFTKEEAKQSTETIIASQNLEKPSKDPETPQSSGSKRTRRKANSKVLGRSPLTILQDDNSPGTLTLRQTGYHSLAKTGLEVNVWPSGLKFAAVSLPQLPKRWDHGRESTATPCRRSSCSRLVESV